MKAMRRRDCNLARSRHAACVSVEFVRYRPAGKPRAVAAPMRSGGRRAGHGPGCRRRKSKPGAARRALMQARTGIEPAPAWQVLRG